MTPESLQVLAADPDLVAELAALWLSGMRGWETLARAVMRRRTGEDMPEVPEGLPEQVRALCVPTVETADGRTVPGPVLGLVLKATEQPEWWAKARARRIADRHSFAAMEFLCDRARNDDKRTLNSANQFMLGAAYGLTPTQRVEVSAAEEMQRLQDALFGKKPVLSPVEGPALIQAEGALPEETES